MIPTQVEGLKGAVDRDVGGKRARQLVARQRNFSQVLQQEQPIGEGSGQQIPAQL